MTKSVSLEKIDSCDPLFHFLSLSMESGEESFKVGILRLNNKHKRYIQELKTTQETIAKERKAQENVSTWQKISTFTEAIFIALGVAAGVCAASAGSTALAIVLITAAIWRIGYEVIQALNLGKTIQDTLIPQELKNRDSICEMLQNVVTTIDIASRIALAAGTAYSAYQMTGKTKDIFQIASLAATGVSAGVSVATGVKRAQAMKLRSMVMENSAHRDYSERDLESCRQEIEEINKRTQKQAQTGRNILDADHAAKSAVVSG